MNIIIMEVVKKIWIYAVDDLAERMNNHGIKLNHRFICKLDYI